MNKPVSPKNEVRVVVPIANGVEEMEAVILVDVFRRAGWQVIVAGVIGSSEVVASRSVRLVPDIALAEVNPESIDVFVLPGGMGGVEVMMSSELVLEWCRIFARTEGKTLAAICAAPRVLDKAGVLEGHRFTCYPGVQHQISTGNYQSMRVVRDGRLHTSMGPGSAFEFAFHLLRHVGCSRSVHQVREALCLP